MWPDSNILNAREGIYWMSVNAARIALGTRTAARRGKFMEEAASWPDGVNGDVRQYVDAMTDSIALPTKDWGWVTPEMDPYTRVVVGNASATFGASHQCCERAVEREANRSGLDKRHHLRLIFRLLALSRLWASRLDAARRLAARRCEHTLRARHSPWDGRDALSVNALTALRAGHS